MASASVARIRSAAEIVRWVGAEHALVATLRATADAARRATLGVSIALALLRAARPTGGVAGVVAIGLLAEASAHEARETGKIERSAKARLSDCFGSARWPVIIALVDAFDAAWELLPRHHRHHLGYHIASWRVPHRSVGDVANIVEQLPLELKVADRNATEELIASRLANGTLQLLLEFGRLPAIDPPAPSLIVHFAKKLDNATRFADAEHRHGRGRIWRGVDAQVEN